MAERPADASATTCTAAREQDIVSFLSSLRRLGMADMASEEDIRDVISDYFVSDIDFGEEEEDELQLEVPVPDPAREAEPSEEADVRRSIIEDVTQSLPLALLESICATAKSPEFFTCSCKYYEGHPCYLQFPRDEVESARLQHFELSREELDMTVLSYLSSCMRRGELTQRPKQAA